MNKAKAAIGREFDSAFRLHSSSLKKKVGPRSPSLACPTLLFQIGRNEFPDALKQSLGTRRKRRRASVSPFPA